MFERMRLDNTLLFSALEYVKAVFSTLENREQLCALACICFHRYRGVLNFEGNFNCQAVEVAHPRRKNKSCSKTKQPETSLANLSVLR